MSFKLPITQKTFFNCLVIVVTVISAQAQSIQENDRRSSEVRHLDLKYTFPKYTTKEQWLVRAAELRKQILVSAGLFPMPEKLPIKAEIFGKIDRGDYTIEKVIFESYPGFYVTGNLYRPSKLTGNAPAVLCPHGHWAYGRLENTPLNSGPARAIAFARQGYVAFSYDMVGYNDSSTITHKFANHDTTEREALWGVNLLGLQLWNSIRSIDFLLTLPDVDPERIACTGESGGGTQTFLLMAVDSRIKVASPVNMVSFIMQGGSLCENAPNLRVDTNNVEIAALMAPRPMMLVSATGDWTRNTLKEEYPAILNIYRLFGAEDKLTAIQVDAPHNYNQQSREAVYGWFAHWMLGRAETTPLKERGGGVPSIPELLVFHNRARPVNELNESQLTASLIESRKRQLADLAPRTATDLQRFKEAFSDAFRFSLLAQYPAKEDLIYSIERQTDKGKLLFKTTLSRSGYSDRVDISMLKNAIEPVKSLVLLLSTLATDDQNELVDQLLKSGHAVVTIKNFQGLQFTEEARKYRYFTTYNRTDIANQIQDILTVLSYLNNKVAGKIQSGGEKIKVNVVAMGNAGLWALLARGLSPEVNKMAVDVAQFDNTNDEAYLKQVPIPGIRRAGDFQTAITISPLNPLYIHNTGSKFQTKNIAGIFRRLGKAGNFITQSTLIDNKKLVEWLSSN